MVTPSNNARRQSRRNSLRKQSDWASWWMDMCQKNSNMQSSKFPSTVYLKTEKLGGEKSSCSYSLKKCQCSSLCTHEDKVFKLKAGDFKHSISKCTSFLQKKHNTRIISGKKIITRFSIISPNHCCKVMGFNFAMLKACKIKFKLRVIFQITHNIKTSARVWAVTSCQKLKKSV